MLRYLPVRKVHARQVLDSRGNPTVEAEVTVGEGIIGINGFTGRAMVPSGASTGKFEAVELRDGNREEYLGQSVKKAVENINTRLADAIIGENALNQANFSLQKKNDTYYLRVRGIGHGVGFSQFGGNEMAKNGSNAEEILKKYFPDMELRVENPEN